MGLNTWMIAGLVLLSTQTFASSEEDYKEKFNTISNIEMSLISTDVLNQEASELLYNKQVIPTNPLDVAGKVIDVSKGLVALGESVYSLVIKGKPTNKTDYTPISVIPKVNGAPVDIFDTELWKAPIKRTYEVRYKNLYRIDVVIFRYSIIFSYGGKYDGRGYYLTGAQIIPESVRTVFGFDFTATMKLGGISNQGTKENPIAAALLLMEHSVNSVMVAKTHVNTFLINGRGGFKAY